MLRYGRLGYNITLTFDSQSSARTTLDAVSTRMMNQHSPNAIDNAMVSLKSSYYLIEYLGSFTLEPLSKLNQQIAELCIATNVKGTLVDVSKAIGELTVLDRYTLAKNMSEFWPADLRLAVVVNKSQTIEANGLVWERMVKSRNYPVRVCFDQLSARQWLISAAK